MKLPALDARVTWSIQVRELDTGVNLLDHASDTLCETASVGKVFLLIEVARRIVAGELDPAARVALPEAHLVRGSGLLHLMREQDLSVFDLALLVGAVSDNLATNALLDLCGLESVQAVGPSLGLKQTTLCDYIRNDRGPDLPWAPSCGTARELCDLMVMLSRGDVISPEVSQMVCEWLAAGADTSMVAAGLLLDPLDHQGPEYLGLELQHKTGSTSVVRVDTGILRGPSANVVYSVAANWAGQDQDLREPVHTVMLEIGLQLRELAGGR